MLMWFCESHTPKLQLCLWPQAPGEPKPGEDTVLAPQGRWRSRSDFALCVMSEFCQTAFQPFHPWTLHPFLFQPHKCVHLSWGPRVAQSPHSWATGRGWLLLATDIPTFLPRSDAFSELA